MLFGLELADVIRAVGLLGVMGIVFAESGLLLGFFLPGDTLLFSAGFLATKNTFGVNIHLLVLSLVAAAILGQSVGYWFGEKVGPRLFKRPNSVFFHPDNIVRAQKFYDKYGALTILIARFVPVVRTFVPIVAGAARMDYKTFTLYNVLGAIAWAGVITYLGYYAGAFLEAQGLHVDALILPVIAIVVVLSAVSPLTHILVTKFKRSKKVQQASGEPE